MTDLSARPPRARAVRSYRRRLVALGALVPLVIAVTGAVVVIAWLPRLPGRVAVHWSAAGADGFASPLLLPTVLVLITALFSALVVTALWKPGDGLRGNGRFLVAVSGWLPTFLAVGFAGTLAPQLDRANVDGVSFPWPVLAVGAVAGILVGAAFWALTPVAPPMERVETKPDEVELGENARALWVDTASAPRPLLAVLGVAAAVLTVVGMSVTFSAGAVGLAFLAAPVVLAVACLTLTWRVRIDDNGLTARPAIGLPRVRIPLDHIRDASVVQVSPVNDFGGWGLRHSSYGTGVILRTGDALRLEQNGGAFTITLDDVPRAAGLVQALLVRNGSSANRPR